MVKEKYYITGMTCASCQQNIIKAIKNLDGVKSVEVNLLTTLMVAEYDEQKVNSTIIIDAVTKIGYGATLASEGLSEKSNLNCKASCQAKSQDYATEWKTIKDQQKSETKKLGIRVVVSTILLLPLLYMCMGPMIGLPNFWFFTGDSNALVFTLSQMFLCLVIVFINKKFFVSGVKALLHKAPNMDTLVALGSGASFVYGLVVLFIMAYKVGHGQISQAGHLVHSLYFESSATILTLVSLGKYFESKSKQKTGSAIEKLLNLSPKTARVIRDNKEVEINCTDIKVGDIVVIRSGDTIPVDGELVQGSGLINESAITGESKLVKKDGNDRVISATICENGSFKFKALKVGENTTLAQIIRLVSEASSSKPHSQEIADKISGWFVPVVMEISLLTFIVWICVSRDIGVALTSAVSVLVISCPCALGLATPVVVMVATGKSASLGILVKSAQSFEQLDKVNTIIFDKTGTITVGSPMVVDIDCISKSTSPGDMLKELAILESNSNHPISHAIVKSVTNENLKNHSVTNFKEVSGMGISATIDKIDYLAGNFKFALSQNLISSEQKSIEQKLVRYQQQGKTPILFFKGKELQGIVTIADKIKDNVKQTVDQLKKMGIKVVMLTGDNKLSASVIAREVGIDNVISDCMPTEKQNVVASFKQQGDRVAMVGDGINDSPALALADVAIAVSNGTDIAIETADIVLTNGNIGLITTAKELSRSTIKNIKINLFWAFFYNALGIPLASGILRPLLGFGLSPMIGSLAMSLSSVCVVLNALRLNLFKPKQIKQTNKGGGTMQKVAIIQGMTCSHCASHVKEALMAIEGVDNAVVDLKKNQAVIEASLPVSDQAIITAVEHAGYKVKKIK